MGHLAKPWVRVCAVTAAAIVGLNLWISNPLPCVAFLAGACLLIVAVVFLVPAGLRKKLGAPTAVFVAAAGTLSIFVWRYR